MCLYTRMLALEWKERAFFRKSELHMFLFISGGHICVPKLYTNMASIMVREMFRQITQKLLASSTGQFQIYFLCRVYCVTVKTIYWWCLFSDVENSGGTPLRMPYRYWSEIVSGFGVPEGTTPLQILRNTPPPLPGRKSKAFHNLGLCRQPS